jgi:hypothetical protein
MFRVTRPVINRRLTNIKQLPCAKAYIYRCKNLYVATVFSARVPLLTLTGRACAMAATLLFKETHETAFVPCGSLQKPLGHVMHTKLL